MSRKRRNIKAVILTFALVLVLSVGGIAAYLSDTESVTNTFTHGVVSIDLQEPSWNPNKASQVVPDYPIAKDPQVINDGENAAFVFLEVGIPFDTARTANDDGSMNEAAEIQLFNYTVNSGWTQLGNVRRDTENNLFVYLYAYGSASEMTALPSGGKTSALFDSVKLANIIESKSFEGAVKNISINAYAIQASSLGENQATKDPASVWAILSAQNIGR